MASLSSLVAGPPDGPPRGAVVWAGSWAVKEEPAEEETLPYSQGGEVIS